MVEPVIEHGYGKGQSVHGTQMTLDRINVATQLGQSWEVGHLFTDVSSGTDAEFVARVDGADKADVDVHLSKIEIDANASCIVRIFTGSSVTSTGTELTPKNLNLGSSKTSNTSVYHGGTYDESGAGEPAEVAPLGSGGGKNLPGSDDGDIKILKADDVFHVQIESLDNSLDVGVNLIWWEEPVREIPS